MLNVRELECVRGDHSLFSGINFELKQHEFLHLRGTNGSGKTTLLRALCGLLAPIHGEILWEGEPINKIRDEYFAHMTFLGHLSGIKGDLSAYENIELFAKLSGQKIVESRISDALVTLGLASRAELPTRVLSQGQKKRVALARLLVLKRKLWILDEPFVALDVDAVALLQKIISEHVAEGGMVVLTTHQEVEIEAGARQELDLSA